LIISNILMCKLHWSFLRFINMSLIMHPSISIKALTSLQIDTVKQPYIVKGFFFLPKIMFLVLTSSLFGLSNGPCFLNSFLELFFYFFVQKYKFFLVLSIFSIWPVKWNVFSKLLPCVCHMVISFMWFIDPSNIFSFMWLIC
jgi:hypothetical protein